MADLRELSAGTLRVGSFATAAAALVPQAIAAFRSAHPGVSVSRIGFVARDWMAKQGCVAVAVSPARRLPRHSSSFSQTAAGNCTASPIRGGARDHGGARSPTAIGPELRPLLDRTLGGNSLCA
ncbi:LysR substrate-binding domain-containing protein [Streptomyces spiralis]